MKPSFHNVFSLCASRGVKDVVPFLAIIMNFVSDTEWLWARHPATPTPVLHLAKLTRKQRDSLAFEYTLSV